MMYRTKLLAGLALLAATTIGIAACDGGDRRDRVAVVPDRDYYYSNDGYYSDGYYYRQRTYDVDRDRRAYGIERRYDRNFHRKDVDRWDRDDSRFDRRDIDRRNTGRSRGSRR